MRSALCAPNIVSLPGRSSIGGFADPAAYFPAAEAPAVLPAADVYATKDEFVIELEVPGFEEKELGIEVTDHTLIVKGERAEARAEKEFRLRERLDEKFERRFHLPTDADTEHVKAKFGKGVLEVHTPKLAISTPHNVEITKA